MHIPGSLTRFLFNMKRRKIYSTTLIQIIHKIQQFSLWIIERKTLTWGGGLGCKDANSIWSNPMMQVNCPILYEVALNPSLCYLWTCPSDHSLLVSDTYAIHEEAMDNTITLELFLVWFSTFISSNLDGRKKVCSPPAGSHIWLPRQAIWVRRLDIMPWP